MSFQEENSGSPPPPRPRPGTQARHRREGIQHRPPLGAHPSPAASCSGPHVTPRTSVFVPAKWGYSHFSLILSNGTSPHLSRALAGGALHSCGISQLQLAAFLLRGA